MSVRPTSRWWFGLEIERASAEALSIPIFPELTPAQIDETVAAIRRLGGPLRAACKAAG